MAISTPSPARQLENPLINTPQTQQTTPHTTQTPGTAAQRSTTPRTTPIIETTRTPGHKTNPERANPAPTPTESTAQPGLPAATATLGSPTAPLRPTTPLNNGTSLQNQTNTTHNNIIGPQGNACTPTSGTWGPPADDTQVNQVPDRDPAAVQWDIDTQCTLTIHHGTTSNDGIVPWGAYRSTITKIHIDGNLTLHDIHGNRTFSLMPALREIQIDGTLHLSQKAANNLFYNDRALTAFTGNGNATIETSQATDMNSMFYGCSRLTTLDVTHFNTTNTTNMDAMFYGCSRLTTLDVTHFNTTNTTNMNSMFALCTSLTTLDVTHFDTTNTIYMNQMFYGCSRLTTLDVTHFNTTNTTDMNQMFCGCSSLTTLDVTHFNTTNTTNMRYMFYGCSSLTTLDVTHFNTTNTTNMGAMFCGCSSLTTLDVTHFNTTNTTDMNSMFYGCSSLTTLDVTHFNTTNTTNMNSMFKGCSKLTSLDLSAIDTRAALNTTGTFDGAIGMLGNTPNLRELWLGPHTHLVRTSAEPDDSIHNALGNTPYDAWVEVPASRPRIPVPDMRARTSLEPLTNPEGHYIITTLTLTIDYNNGQTDHTGILHIHTANPGSKQIDWRHRPAPAGKVFDRWDLTTGDPARVTIAGNTLNWTSILDDSTATITAKWRTLPQPSLTINVHADGTPDPWGGTGPWSEIGAAVPAADWRTGDIIELRSLNGTGATTSCTARTCTAILTIAQLRDVSDYDATYHLTATVTTQDIRTDPAGTTQGNPADKQGILPYTTVNHHTGTGTGTPPATAKALTDTASRKALLTIVGPSPIVRPDHHLFLTWQANHGTACPGTTPVSATLGDTDTDGRTTIDLTAQWTTLDAPAITGATRDQTTNKTTVTGTAKPTARGTVIHVCHPDGAGARQCHDTTPSDTDANGNTMPYDGTTEHPWTVTLPSDAPMEQYTADATTTATDTAYPVGNDQVESPVAHIQVPPLDQHTLPLTGAENRRAFLLTATALAAAMILLAATTSLRNRKRNARHRNTGQPTSTGQR